MAKDSRSFSRLTYPEYSLKGLMLMLGLQYSGHLMRSADSLEKALMLGKTEGRGQETGTSDIFCLTHPFATLSIVFSMEFSCSQYRISCFTAMAMKAK